MHQTAPNTWEPWTRAGDRALISIHSAWGKALARLWAEVDAVRVVLP